MRVHAPISLGIVLAAAALKLGSQSIPPVFLNHVTIFVPASVYAQLLQASFLRNEFSGFQEQTLTARSEARGTYNYTGIYLRGQHTYLELFESATVQRPGEPEARRAGNIGFNMSIDNRDRLPVLRDRVAAEMGMPLQIDTVRIGGDVPSYDVVTQSPKFARQLAIAVTASLKAYYPDGITREEQTQRRKTYLPDRLLHDVTGITVTVNPAELEQLLQAFRAYGYTIRKEGEKQIASGPDIRFTLLPEKPHSTRMIALDLSLNREKTGTQKHSFDSDSELQFSGTSARWTFSFPGN
jgi:uncharacterized protein DUF5829